MVRNTANVLAGSFWSLERIYFLYVWKVEVCGGEGGRGSSYNSIYITAGGRWSDRVLLRGMGNHIHDHVGQRDRDTFWRCENVDILRVLICTAEQLFRIPILAPMYE